MPRPTAVNAGATSTPRKPRQRGAQKVYVIYEVTDANGNVVEGYRAKFVRVEKDKNAVLEKIGQGIPVGNLMVVTIPLNEQGAQSGEATAENVEAGSLASAAA